MPNQFETHTSDTGTTIHLKMNGELIENLIALDFLMLTFFDIVFIYGVYDVYAENDGALTLILIFLFLPFLFYLHNEYRKNKRWAKNAEETFFISKNNLRISKECLGEKLLTKDINTQKIIEIVYRPWNGGLNPPFLPDCSQGTIHVIGYDDGCSFGINLNKEEAEAFITELRSLIMQQQEPRHFIFAPHMHLTKS
ncbi:hypothetical protein RMB13_16115 [Acinetobacter sp. V102_4]|uniref:hypothetical protein n=1 Tax=Acinetobacter sp. V102_4 TaxID=3072984 RepID=UPI00287C777B|nr:hypothetical protein [Acinetobacter sp. V102_4]MDS7930967.1 hypothetical protein [Acinetobacter sp. V102_4]